MSRVFSAYLTQQGHAIINDADGRSATVEAVSFSGAYEAFQAFVRGKLDCVRVDLSGSYWIYDGKSYTASIVVERKTMPSYALSALRVAIAREDRRRNPVEQLEVCTHGRK